MTTKSIFLTSLIGGLLFLTIISLYNPRETKYITLPPDVNILIEGTIDSENTSIIEAKVILRDKTIKGHINVEIETPGGSLIECWILSQLLSERSVTVSSKAVASSCGAMLLASGANLSVEPGTLILLHMAWNSEGKAYDAVQDQWINFIAIHYGDVLTPEERYNIVTGQDVIITGASYESTYAIKDGRGTIDMLNKYREEKLKYLDEQKDIKEEKELLKRIRKFNIKKTNEALDIQEKIEEH